MDTCKLCIYMYIYKYMYIAEVDVHVHVYYHTAIDIEYISSGISDAAVIMMSLYIL